MAGSDLDGDLYFVTWHEELILKKENEPPMHFPNAEESHLDRPITELDIINQLKFIVESDNTGRISRQHLIFADLKGIRSDECMRLADLSAQMYDAPKTGVVPEWPKDLKTKQAPDFLEKNDHRESYESQQVLGKLYRHSKLMLETVSELSMQKHRPAWKLDEYDDNDDCSVTVTAPVAEQANMLQESYSNVMRHVSQTCDIQTEVSIWRARFPNFKFTDEEIKNHTRLIKDFHEIYRTTQAQQRSVVQELEKQGKLSENDIKHQLHCHCKQSRKPLCAGLPLMLYEAKPEDRTSFTDQTYVYRQAGRKVLHSLKPASKFRSVYRLQNDSIQRLVNKAEIIPIGMFRQHNWLLALASFLAESFCRPEEDSQFLHQKLDCILRVLRHVIITLELCSMEDIVDSKDSAGWMMFVVRRLTKHLHSFLRSADKDDVMKVGKAAAYTLWDIYTKQETSKEHGYENWEWELKGDAIKMLLKIAFRSDFDTPTTSMRTSTAAV